jgi:hypothetical protein
MTDWSTIASLATAAGTLVLALATFVAVRAANRAARIAEYSMQIGIRPLLIPSRLEDPVQKVMWPDEHWIELPGAGVSVEEVDGDILMAMSLRNAGSGVGLLHGWHLVVRELRDPHPHADPEEFRRQLRDLYIPGGDIGFWQGALRDHDDPEYPTLVEVVRARRLFAVELLYSDHEGGQRAVTRFAFAPTGGSAWMGSMVRHWDLDRPDPRDAS